jgi:hypothetical protein
MGRCCTSGSEDNEDNGRDLWAGLGLLKPFRDWVKHQINSLTLAENQDFVKSHQKVRGGLRAEYHFTLDTAKHMASRVGEPGCLSLGYTWGNSTGEDSTGGVVPVPANRP